MSAAAVKAIVIGCCCLMVACSQSFGLGTFPTEQELQANLRRDMTPAQVVGLFGEPSGGRPENCVTCEIRYLAPIGMLTVEQEGYTGFEVQFRDGKVAGWRVFRGYPSYNPSMPMPAVFKWDSGFWEFWSLSESRLLYSSE